MRLMVAVIVMAMTVGGVTVAMLNGHVTENRLADIAGKTRNVPDNCELLTVARRMGISMG